MKDYDLILESAVTGDLFEDENDDLETEESEKDNPQNTTKKFTRLEREEGL